MQPDNPLKQFLNIITVLALPLIILMAYALADVKFPYQPDRIDLSALYKERDKGKIVKQHDRDTVVVDSATQRILFIGDSMIEGLGPRMSQWAEVSGHELTNVCWYGSSTEKWVESDTLRSFIKRSSPTFVMICLGSNEQFVRDIDKRARYVDAMLAAIGDIPYVWICPPAWKKDTGINDMIKERVGQKHFFDSRNLHFDRGKDHVHPVKSSFVAWMDNIAQWLQSQNTAHPIVLVEPQPETKGKCHSYYLSIE